jgi:hypothetical protein
MKKIFAIVGAFLTGAISLSVLVPSGVDAAFSAN